MTTKVLLAFGDSNTHGTKPLDSLLDLGRWDAESRWTGVAAASLGAGWRVVEEGLPGRTTVFPDPVGGVYRNGIEHLPVALESHRPIDAIVVMLGTNDVKHRFHVPVVEIGEAIARMLRLIAVSACGPKERAPGVLLVAPPPVIETGCLAEIFEGGAEKSRRLAGVYAEVARRAGAEFLDAGAHIAVSPVDGVHYDASEHRTLGTVIAERVRERWGDWSDSRRGGRSWCLCRGYDLPGSAPAGGG